MPGQNGCSIFRCRLKEEPVPERITFRTVRQCQQAVSTPIVLVVTVGFIAGDPHNTVFLRFGLIRSVLLAPAVFLDCLCLPQIKEVQVHTLPDLPGFPALLQTDKVDLLGDKDL